MERGKGEAMGHGVDRKRLDRCELIRDERVR